MKKEKKRQIKRNHKHNLTDWHGADPTNRSRWRWKRWRAGGSVTRHPPCRPVAHHICHEIVSMYLRLHPLVLGLRYTRQNNDDSSICLRLIPFACVFGSCSVVTVGLSQPPRSLTPFLFRSLKFAKFGMRFGPQMGQFVLHSGGSGHDKMHNCSYSDLQ